LTYTKTNGIIYLRDKNLLRKSLTYAQLINNLDYEDTMIKSKIPVEEHINMVTMIENFNEGFFDEDGVHHWSIKPPEHTEDFYTEEDFDVS